MDLAVPGNNQSFGIRNFTQRMRRGRSPGGNSHVDRWQIWLSLRGPSTLLSFQRL